MTSRTARARIVGAGVLFQALVLAGTAGARQGEQASETALGGAPARWLEGLVLGSDGNPAAGARVVASNGAWTVTGAGGEYRLRIELAPGAASVRLTAFASGAAGRVAGTTVALAPAGATTQVDPLALVSACGPAWLPTFGAQPGVDGEVHALLVHDDGSGPALFVGGAFVSAGGVLANGIAKWDGASWTPLGSGVSGGYAPTSVSPSVRALAVHDDGSGPALYAGGNFTSAGGVPASYVARWDGSGWSALGSGVNFLVHALTVHDAGGGPRLIVGGEFTQAGGMSAGYIARWDGTSWAPNGFLDGPVRALAIYDAGNGPELHAGGDFDTALLHHLARWNGTSWRQLGAGANGSVHALLAHDDGSGPALFAGGSFGTAGGAGASRVAKWDGSSWAALGSGVGGTLVPVVNALAAYDDGSGAALYAGGTFASAGGVAASSVARWDGAGWSALAGGVTAEDTAAPVRALAAFDAGGGESLFAAGALASAGGLSANRIARWDGATWARLGPGLDREVLALAVFDDGSGPALYAGGRFTTVGPVEARAIARWDGTSWSALGSGLDHPHAPSLAVRALAVHDDGSGPALYVGGDFTDAGGIAVNGLARWDGVTWSAVGSYSGGTTGALASDGGDWLYAGSNGVRRWNGTGWTALGTLGGGTFGDPRVHALLVGSDGQLYAGGDFTSGDNLVLGNVAAWGGTTWSALGAGLSGPVHALAEFDDGTGPALLAGGAFQPGAGIARWDGASWSGLGSGVSGSGARVVALGVHDDGSGPALYAGGAFTGMDGLAARSLARWNGASWSTLGSGLVGSALAFATYDDGSGPALLVGGGALDSGDSHLSRWGPLPDLDPPVLACPAPIHVQDTPGSPSGEVVNFTVRASDGCDPAPSVVCVPPSGSFFPRGTTLVTCTATDAAGNQATCQFTVLVGNKARRR